eukprot:Lankesteria_metandrocarpae@DN3282_c1_g1_i2.p1
MHLQQSAAAKTAAGLKSRKIPSFKVVLLGEASVGKTSIVSRFSNDSFSDATDTTIGAAFCPHTIEVDGKPIKFEIWDTAGQERFSSLAPMYYRGAAAAIIVYDQTRASSYDRAQAWVQQVQLSNPDVVICMTGNKSDLPNRAVDAKEIQEYCESEGLFYVETSAKTGQNVAAVFDLIGRNLPINGVEQQDPNITLHGTGEQGAGDSEQKGFSCCLIG